MCPQPPQPVCEPSGLMSLQLEPVPEISTMPPAGGTALGTPPAPYNTPQNQPLGYLITPPGASHTTVGGGGHGPQGVGGEVITLAQAREAAAQLRQQQGDGILLVPPAQGQPLPPRGRHPGQGGDTGGGQMGEDGGSPANGEALLGPHPPCAWPRSPAPGSSPRTSRHRPAWAPHGAALSPPPTPSWVWGGHPTAPSSSTVTSGFGDPPPNCAYPVVGAGPLRLGQDAPVRRHQHHPGVGAPSVGTRGGHCRALRCCHPPNDPPQ